MKYCYLHGKTKDELEAERNGPVYQLVPLAKQYSILQPLLNRSKQRRSAVDQRTQIDNAVDTISSYFQQLGSVLGTARHSLTFGYHLRSIKGTVDPVTRHFQLRLCLRESGFQTALRQDANGELSFAIISTFLECTESQPYFHANSESVDGSQPMTEIRPSRRDSFDAGTSLTNPPKSEPSILQTVDMISSYFDNLPAGWLGQVQKKLPEGLNITAIDGDIELIRFQPRDEYTFILSVHDSKEDFTHQLKFNVPV